VFCFLRGDISENIDQNTTELFEEMGVQTDEDVDVSYEAFSKLQAKKRRMWKQAEQRQSRISRA